MSKSIEKAIADVKRHLHPAQENAPCTMLEDMYNLCQLAIKDHERDTRKDFEAWTRLPHGRRILQQIGLFNAYECFLAGRTWRPPTDSETK